MHYHTPQQCPSCYMYCMSRVTGSSAPPVPPHGNVDCRNRSDSPHRTQPRAVTLPHPCSHPFPPPAPQSGGPRARFGSLPHQSSPKPCISTVRAPLVRPQLPFKEEKPPPLPPHGPPPFPPDLNSSERVISSQGRTGKPDADTTRTPKLESVPKYPTEFKKCAVENNSGFLKTSVPGDNFHHKCTGCHGSGQNKSNESCCDVGSSQTLPHSSQLGSSNMSMPNPHQSRQFPQQSHTMRPRHLVQPDQSSRSSAGHPPPYEIASAGRISEYGCSSQVPLHVHPPNYVSPHLNTQPPTARNICNADPRNISHKDVRSIGNAERGDSIPLSKVNCDAKTGSSQGNKHNSSILHHPESGGTQQCNSQANKEPSKGVPSNVDYYQSYMHAPKNSVSSQNGTQGHANHVPIQNNSKEHLTYVSCRSENRPAHPNVCNQSDSLSNQSTSTSRDQGNAQPAISSIQSDPCLHKNMVSNKLSGSQPQNIVSHKDNYSQNVVPNQSGPHVHPSIAQNQSSSHYQQSLPNQIGPHHPNINYDKGGFKQQLNYAHQHKNGRQTNVSSNHGCPHPGILSNKSGSSSHSKTVAFNLPDDPELQKIPGSNIDRSHVVQNPKLSVHSDCHSTSNSKPSGHSAVVSSSNFTCGAHCGPHSHPCPKCLNQGSSNQKLQMYGSYQPHPPFKGIPSDHSKCPSNIHVTNTVNQTNKGIAHCAGQHQQGPPPPPPLPPPPMLPPMSLNQLKYACLPHQMLVPPPIPQDIVFGCPEHGHHHISSTKADRAHCGPGPPGRSNRGAGPLNKARSLEAPPQLSHGHPSSRSQNGHPPFRRNQIISYSSVNVNPRSYPLGPRSGAVDDSGRAPGGPWRRNGMHQSGQTYELSQDLADKRIEMLERRYGGDRARRAATTIQRAYRHYAMQKKFRAITATAKAHQEKRLSRRFTLDHGSDWSLQDAEQRMRIEFDKLNSNINNSVYCDSRRPSRSLSMRDSSSRQISKVDLDPLNDSSLYCHATMATAPSNTVPNGGVYPSSSVDTNSYASSKDMKYLGSEDSGFISQEPLSGSKSSSASSSTCSSGRSKSSTASSSYINRCSASRKVPPDVPRRSSSIKSSESADRCADNGSLSSVQSSGSDFSLSHTTSERITPISSQGETQESSDFASPPSPVWKRKAQTAAEEAKRLCNISEGSEDIWQPCSHGPHSARYAHLTSLPSYSKTSDTLRKRQYRVGLNLFNKKPERGINYLISKGFFERSPSAVAKFLLTRRGLSKQMIGEYLGDLQNNLNASILESFSNEIDLSGMQVDVALRKFQTYFRMPGEAQKIERIMQVFAQRYCQCNRDIVAKLRDPETVFVLAFAIIMLNTDLHTQSLKAERRMKLEDFIKNLRGVDDGADIEREMLEGMYYRIKDQEFRPGQDHVMQVLRVQQTIVGKKPALSLPHRRLVCYCRLYEIPDPNKKEKLGLHQREVFLFNDLLVITKIFPKKKNPVTYTFRRSITLAGLSIACKEVPHYSYLIEIHQRVDNKLLISLNARNEHDRTKFCEDLRESILEMDEMENLRIESELERVKPNLRASRPNSTAENRDSGVADMELIPAEKSLSISTSTTTLKPEGTLKRTALSNSLLDIHKAGSKLSNDKSRRMSANFGSTLAIPSKLNECFFGKGVHLFERIFPLSSSLGDLSAVERKRRASLPNCGHPLLAVFKGKFIPVPTE